MIKDAIYILILLCVIAYMQKKDAEDIAYTQALEVVLTSCLSDNTGKPVIIGKDVYLCGIYHTGEKI
jgi:hypothetical protein